MASLRHDLIAVGIPKMRGSLEIDSEDKERARIERWHRSMDRSLPTNAVLRFDKRFAVETRTIGEDAAEGTGFPVHTITKRGSTPRRTVLYLHGGGYTAPLDPFHVRYAARLAAALDARVLLPDYPLAPEHTWADSHDALVELAAALTSQGPTVVAGDSAGGGLALAVAQSLRDRGGAQPTHLLLHSPWVDLTTSTPATAWFARRDPWLRITKLHA
ncbi:MAG: alpha/beta hydrolase, partial [Nocardioides sp.]